MLKPSRVGLERVKVAGPVVVQRLRNEDRGLSGAKFDTPFRPESADCFVRMPQVGRVLRLELGVEFLPKVRKTSALDAPGRARRSAAMQEPINPGPGCQGECRKQEKTAKASREPPAQR